MERRSTQPEHQWTYFTLSSVTASFPGLLTLLGSLGLLICQFVGIPQGKDLQETIRVEVVQIDRTMLEREEANFQEGLQKCIHENGHHMKDIVFQT